MISIILLLTVLFMGKCWEVGLIDYSNKRKMRSREVSDIYNDFKEFCQYELADDDNPHLAPCSFGQMPPAGLASLTIPLVGLEKVNTRRINKKLEQFRDGNAVLCSEEGINGKPDWHIEIPLPRKSKKTRKHSKKHRHGGTDMSPSCTKLLLLVLLFVTILFVGYITQF